MLLLVLYSMRYHAVIMMYNTLDIVIMIVLIYHISPINKHIDNEIMDIFVYLYYALYTHLTFSILYFTTLSYPINIIPHPMVLSNSHIQGTLFPHPINKTSIISPPLDIFKSIPYITYFYDMMYQCF
jgi:hypothetical protein